MKLLKQQIHLLIADDHPAFREGLKTIFKPIPHITVIGEASDGKMLVEMAGALNPDVILTDIMMPEMDGIAAVKLLCSNINNARIVALSMYDEENLIFEIMEAGAIGYILKTASRKTMVAAVETAFRHKPFFDETVTDILLRYTNGKQKPTKVPPTDLLTEQEKKIIRFLCREYTTKEIADEMKLSVRTVEGYRLKIMSKIGARSHAGIILYAVRCGMVD